MPDPDYKLVLLWRSDLHLADQAPQSRTDDWTSTLLGKAAQVGELARQVKAQAVLDGGDFFHIKQPSRNSHELVARVAALHDQYPCPVYATVGNHDVKYGDIANLEQSPLGVLFSTGVFRRLYDQHEASFTCPQVPQGYPHVSSIPDPLEVKVRVVGVPYHGTKYDLNRLTTIVKKDEDWLVAVVHCLASPRGGSLFEGEDVLKYGDLADLAPDVWCLGHWHKDQGIQEIAPRKWVVNIGSMSRGSLSADEVGRTPACAVLSFTKQQVQIEHRPLDVRPAAEVFNLEGKQRADSRQTALDTLVDNLRTVILTREDRPSLLDAVRALDVPEPVKERAVAYLEKAGTR